MTRDRHRPLQLESLEAKQLLSTLSPTLKTIGANVVRQSSTTAVHQATTHTNPLSAATSPTGHSRVSQGGAARAGRAQLANTLRLNLVSRGASFDTVGGHLGASTRLNLPLGLSSPVSRTAVSTRSTAPSAPLGSARIGGGPSSTPMPTAAAVPTSPAAPTFSATQAHALSLPPNLR